MRPEIPSHLPNGFEFTEQEKLYDRISDQRFVNWFEDEQTSIHEITISSNTYGEFLFVTLSRPSYQGHEYLTFYGKGWHEHRERWIIDEWFWYRPHGREERYGQSMSRQEAMRILKQRQLDIAPYITEENQTSRGRLFEMLADLTDEDGALAELDDMDDLLDDLFE